MRSERFNINILSPLKMLDIKAGQKTFIDMSILIPVLFLISIGIVMIASASLSVSEFKYGDRLFFLKRHLFYVSLSLICLYIAFRIPTNVWGKYSSYLIMACLFLLGLVLIPGIGIERNGSQRWLNIFGFTFQVSEWVKLSFIIFLAHYINLNKKSFFLKHQPIIKISILFLVVSALLIAEPDFGSFVLIGFTLVSMLFIAGIRLRYFISILALVTVSFWILAEISPYRLSRITSYLDPWSEQFSSGYQLTQSLIAFGRGEWMGVGLGQSVQKMLYLPEAHTDFVFAIYAEEFGFFGVTILISVYCFLSYKIFLLSWNNFNRKDYFSGLLLFGIGTLFVGQTFINLGVNSGLLPTKGLTLPFVSYGGNSLLVSSIMLGMVLRVSSHNRFAERGSHD